MNSHLTETLRATRILGPANDTTKVEASPSSHCTRGGEFNAEVSSLVQRLFVLPSVAKAPGAVAFCGVNAGAGCTWVCAKAGQSLAEQISSSICIVDANLRRPSLHEYFAVKPASGFVDLMKSPAPAYDFAQRVSPMNLWLVPAGSTGDGSNGTLVAAKLRTRLAELRNEFDFVLIDTPALDSCSDAILLGQQTDGIVLVVDSRSTRRETALNAKRNIEAAQIPMLGAVLNRRAFPIPEAIYRNI